MEGLWGLLPLLILGSLALFAIWWTRRSQKRRKAEMAAVAERLSLMFFPEGDPSIPSGFGEFTLMQRGRDHQTSNLIRGETEHVDVNLFDYRYVTGSGKHRATHQTTIVTFASPSLRLPQFELGPEGLWHKIASRFGYQDINFAGHPDFNKRYVLRGANEGTIRKLFTVEVVEHFEGQSDRQWMQGSRGRLIIYTSALIKPAKIPEFLKQAFETYGALKTAHTAENHVPSPDEDVT